MDLLVVMDTPLKESQQSMETRMRKRFFAAARNDHIKDPMTQEAELVAPLSVHWEIGNAFSALLKRGRVTLEQALQAIDMYLEIPVRFVEVELANSLKLAGTLGIYAYDAYLLRCAEKYRLPLLRLTSGSSRLRKTKGFPFWR